MGTSENIRRFRLQSGMTQHELGQAIGVSGMAISQYENGYSLPRVGKIKAMAKVFGVDPAAIVAEDLQQKQSPIETYFNMLNSDGQAKALEYVMDLTDMPKYRK